MNDFLRMPVAYCLVGIGAALFEPMRAGWWGLAVLGAVISLYAFLAKGDKDQGRFQTGDNCYFIGFVYTLSIITLSLILDAKDLLENSGEQGLHPLLKTIGIALGTSVVGMLWRFGLTYDVRVGEDAFDKAVQEAAVAASSLKGVVQVLEQTIKDASEAIEGQSQTSRSSLDRLLEVFHDRLDTAAAEVSEALQSVVARAVENIEQHGSSLTQSTTGMVEILRRNAESHATAVRESLNGISSSLDSYASVVDASAKRVGETLDRAAQQALTQIANGVAEALQANTFADARQALGSAVQAHKEAVFGVNHTLTNAVDGLRNAAARAVAYADEAREALAAIEGVAPRQDLDAVTQSIAQFGEAVARLTDQISQLVEGQAKATAETQRYGQQLAELQNTLSNFQLPQGVAPNRPNPEPTVQQPSPSGNTGWWPWRR